LVTSLLLVGLVATAASAQGFVRLSWDNCDPYVQDKGVGGIPGDAIVKQILSIAGEDRENFGHLTFLQAVGAGVVPDAWRFDAAGCPSAFDPTLFSASTDGVNPFTCPAFKSADEGPGFAVTYDGSKLQVELSQVYVTPFLPTASKRYTLWQLGYNLGTSVFFPPGDPNYCPGIEDPVCFHLLQSGLVLDIGVLEPLGFSEDFVTWQDPNNDLRCPLPTQSQESTWGTIKGMYR
jgi:hypothetical protein